MGTLLTIKIGLCQKWPDLPAGVPHMGLGMDRCILPGIIQCTELECISDIYSGFKKVVHKMVVERVERSC